MSGWTARWWNWLIERGTEVFTEEKLLLEVYEEGELVAWIDNEGDFTCADRERMVRALRFVGSKLDAAKKPTSDGSSW